MSQAPTKVSHSTNEGQQYQAIALRQSSAVVMPKVKAEKGSQVPSA